MGDINMTPLIDVMLVLVVILLITAPLLVSAVKVELPKTPSASTLEAPRFLSLTIDRAGRSYVNDQPIETSALASALILAAQQNADTEVRLRVDSTVAYGRVVEVMGVAHAAGFHRIAFVAEPPRPLN